ncbi:MAG: MotA/TolQ/ExbB proton channel family protein [Verrucomicrobiota bacterium]|nr:MotA/TolQ/ExbB proton channel family protein [Verrucomicrobiota bacterium]
MQLVPVLASGLLMGKTPMELFVVGGPIMWPMIFLSFVASTVVIERTIFAIREKSRRKASDVKKLMEMAHNGDLDGAAEFGKNSSDFIARILGEALSHRSGSMEDAFSRAASQELTRYSQGLAVMDTAITAAPLLGLLGTVTGMMNSFGKIEDMSQAGTSLTAGIAEALVATMCGLFIAVTSLIPYNYLNSRLEEARREVDEAGSTLELTLRHVGLNVDGLQVGSDDSGEAPQGKSKPARA